MSNIDPKARTWAEIDMAALKHNFEIAKRTGKKVLCVIKANAYGHGAVPVAKAALEAASSNKPLSLARSMRTSKKERARSTIPEKASFPSLFMKESGSSPAGRFTR